MQRILDTTAGGSQDYPRITGNMAELVRECMRTDLSQHDDVKQIDLSFVAKEPLEPLLFHELDLRRVITNLVLNAAQASPHRARVHIELWQENGETTLAVTDEGHGIEQEVHDRIFEQHFTVRSHGYGLGLASCKEIIEEIHGGNLSFTSEPGIGTTFRCRLPMD